jgi:ribosomal protein S18 acetylase RimI-like enzyme
LLKGLGSEVGAADIAGTLKLLKRVGEPPLVAEQGEVVGCVTWHASDELHLPDPLGRIPVVVVAAEARKRGIGKALVEAAEARLAERGCTRIEVTSSLERSGALAFYQASGFERSGFLLTKRL